MAAGDPTDQAYPGAPATWGWQRPRSDPITGRMFGIRSTTIESDLLG